MINSANFRNRTLGDLNKFLPTLNGNPNITDQLLKGVKLSDRTYKNHLDGYNQLDLLEGKAPSARHEFFYFGGPHLGAISHR